MMSYCHHPSVQPSQMPGRGQETGIYGRQCHHETLVLVTAQFCTLATSHSDHHACSPLRVRELPFPSLYFLVLVIQLTI